MSEWINEDSDWNTKLYCWSEELHCHFERKTEHCWELCYRDSEHSDRDDQYIKLHCWIFKREWQNSRCRGDWDNRRWVNSAECEEWKNLDEVQGQEWTERITLETDVFFVISNLLWCWCLSSSHTNYSSL